MLDGIVFKIGLGVLAPCSTSRSDTAAAWKSLITHKPRLENRRALFADRRPSGKF
jgi:hypothetical protein